MNEEYGKEQELSALEEFDRIMAEFEDVSEPEEQAEDAAAAAETAVSAAEAAGGIEGLEEMVEELNSEVPANTGEEAGTSAAAASAPAHAKTKVKKARKKKHRRRMKFGPGKAILICLVVFLAACGVGGYFVYNWVYDAVKDLPEINPNNIYDLLSENSVILDADGNLLDNVYRGSDLRTLIEYNDIPKETVDAFVAIEDKTFFEHRGFNFIRIVGAVVQAVTGQSDRIGGTSTITQQLARNLYLADIRTTRSLERKVQEAYYTLVIENTLSKEQIIEAYLNSIYLGYNTTGIEAASQAYFSKEVKDLGLIESAVLASLPQSPTNYAPIKRMPTSDITEDMDIDIITQTDEWTVYYNDSAESRVRLVLYYMHEQGKIDDETYLALKDENIRDHIVPGTDALSGSSTTSYFSDYVIQEVRKDLMKAYNLTESEANDLIYTGGLTIYSTLNPTIQNIMEDEFSKVKNFPENTAYHVDKQNNVLDADGNIKLNDKNKTLDEYGNFILLPNEWEWTEDGSLKLMKGCKLNFYKTTVSTGIEYTSEFKGLYEVEKDEETGKKLFYSQAGYLNIPGSYKDRDENGDLIVSKSYFDDMMAKGRKIVVDETEDGKLKLSNSIVVLQQKVLQPQSAMAVVDYANGYLVGMVGGRGIEGKLLYNRATSTRQPGSSIKPLAVYSLALQTGFEQGGTFTAATPIDDAPMNLGGKPWPKNWYTGYKGITNLRNAVEQSINACAVNLYMQLDPLKSVENLQKMGITSVVTSGSVNDMNASALALGGMTYGISPLQMASAYGTFGNYGVHVETTSYTKIVNNRGIVILESPQESVKVLDEPVASLMTDILHTTVTHGLADEAKIKSQPTAGKTGTTSDRYDIWFCGFTPKYSAAVWIGNDTNFELSSSSSGATKLWAKVMERVGALDEKGEFELRGDFVKVTVDKFSGKLPSKYTKMDPRKGVTITEIFIKGTQPKSEDDSHQVCNVCADTGYLATPYCQNIVQKICVQRPSGQSWESTLISSGFKLGIGAEPDAKYDVPAYYCPVHNPDTKTYPVSKLASSGQKQYVDVGVLEPEKPKPAGKDEFGNDYYKDENGNIYYLDAYGNKLTYDEKYPKPTPAGKDKYGNTYYKDTDGSVYYLDSAGNKLTYQQMYPDEQPETPPAEENTTPVTPPAEENTTPETPAEPETPPADGT